MTYRGKPRLWNWRGNGQGCFYVDDVVSAADGVEKINQIGVRDRRDHDLLSTALWFLESDLFGHVDRIVGRRAKFLNPAVQFAFVRFP